MIWLLTAKLFWLSHVPRTHWPRGIMIRIFVVDDHPLLRIGLRWLLEAQGDIQVIGEAGSVADAMIMIPAAGPDLVLCDFHLPDGDGLDVAQRLLQELP